ncbi:MAG: hypothetical protein WCP97_00435 [bacterium]
MTITTNPVKIQTVEIIVTLSMPVYTNGNPDKEARLKTEALLQDRGIDYDLVSTVKDFEEDNADRAADLAFEQHQDLVFSQI